MKIIATIAAKVVIEPLSIAVMQTKLIGCFT